MLALILGIDHNNETCTMCHATVIETARGHHTLVFSDGSSSDQWEYATHEIEYWDSRDDDPTHVLIPIEAICTLPL